MKILVYPHHLEIGGSQTNAIDLATQLRDAHGHEVVFFGTPGPAAALLHERKIRLLPAPAAFGAPSARMIAALARVVREQRPDVVHAWDWPQCVNALLALGSMGALGPLGVPFAGSDMNNLSVSAHLPKSVPMTFGTEETVDVARSLGHRRLLLLEPPVDTGRDDPDAVDGTVVRKEHGVGADELLVVAVSRLVGWLKLEGLIGGIEAVGELAARYPVRFLVVGSGTAEDDLRRRAAVVNEAAGREVVTVPGPMLDPRGAYAAADIVLGMGGSALRGLAFGKPVLLTGERGFSTVVSEDTVTPLFWRGYYGVGDGTPSDLAGQLETLLVDAELRARLGGWARDLVLRRYSLEVGGRNLDGFLREAVSRPPARLDILRDLAAIAPRATASRVIPPSVRSRLRGGPAPSSWADVAVARGTQDRSTPAGGAPAGGPR
ncbi:Glycosyltransferase involved in cell wall bisynthesis [Parafrankia irregularis]|uniref:Glycosyltransferase involved in cell wall bisynthesis n=1 Tax=Parafrankia irregularis TaxID=795642 RepID=A0A0S4QSB9_9ACTN|nr:MULTISPECIES: glycosyltransferase family 4 protein [Parafrankia]MBE3205007.1 glycosyltransferase family 4 protein [Parafrankia sp. CH37]CUU58517.1 Glycosyltransferase involved in cell wall bisynthesis [Parafrankia irregularis]